MSFLDYGYIRLADQTSPDVNIPAPSPSGASIPASVAPTPAPSAPLVVTPDGSLIPGIAGVSTTDIVIGVTIIVVAALIAFFLRSAVRNHLITARKAGISTAGNAGWALFAFLLSIAITATFGFIGQLWTLLPFVIPMGVLDVVTLILFIILFSSANRGRR